MLWAGISEIYGRKIVYMISFAMFALTQLGCALSNSPGLFLAMRVLSACGGSAVLTIGGGTLVSLSLLSFVVQTGRDTDSPNLCLQADIYDPHERGTMVGIYYLFPVLGPSVGTLLGGALSLTEPEWRTTFWFMFAYAALVFVWSIFFQDTFRKERSLAWRAAYKRAVIAAKLKDENRKEAAFQAAKDGNTLSNPSGRGKLPWNRTNTKSSAELKNGKGGEKEALERETNKKILLDARKKLSGTGAGLTKVTTETGEEIPVKVSFRDVK